MLLLGERRWPVVTAMSIASSVFVEVAFARLLSIPLPLDLWNR